MNRWAGWVAVGVALASSAWAGPRFAVHPLDARELATDEREWLKAFTEVRLARTPGIRLAGSARLEDAVRSAKGRDCETNDACLVYLANATDSLYGVFARIRRDPASGDWMMVARVVRADGTLVRTTVRRAAKAPNATTLDRAKALVADVFDALDLRSLPEAPPPDPGLEHLPPPPMVPVETLRLTEGPTMSPRRTLGLLIGAVGLATLTTGGAVLFSSVESSARLTPDDDGSVPPGQERLRREAAAQGEAAVILIPTGALLALTGTLVAFWPDAPVKVSAMPLREGGAFAISGVLP